MLFFFYYYSYFTNEYTRQCYLLYAVNRQMFVFFFLDFTVQLARSKYFLLQFKFCIVIKLILTLKMLKTVHVRSFEEFKQQSIEKHSTSSHRQVPNSMALQHYEDFKTTELKVLILVKLNIFHVTSILVVLCV